MNQTAVDSDLRDLYQDLILDHSKHPHNFHAVDNANREGLGHNPLCGDRLSLQMKVDADDIIREVGFQGSGCAISVASASMMTDMLKGKSVAEAAALFGFMHASCTGENTPHIDMEEDDRGRLQALAGVRHYPMRVKCATLAWHTMQAALKNEKPPRSSGVGVPRPELQQETTSTQSSTPTLELRELIKVSTE